MTMKTVKSASGYYKIDLVEKTDKNGPFKFLVRAHEGGDGSIVGFWAAGGRYKTKNLDKIVEFVFSIAEEILGEFRSKDGFHGWSMTAYDTKTNDDLVTVKVTRITTGEHIRHVDGTFSGDYELKIIEQNPVPEKTGSYQFKVWGYEPGYDPKSGEDLCTTTMCYLTFGEVIEEVLEFAEDILRESEEGENYSGWTFHAENQDPKNEGDFVVVKIERVRSPHQTI